MSPENRIFEHLTVLYGVSTAEAKMPILLARLVEFEQRQPQLKTTTAPQISERDAILITYGDQISAPDQPALRTLADFLEVNLKDAVNGVHILPFYPYSSDDGFSVIDYRQVDPTLGTWEDISRMNKSFRLMFDAVINHISRMSDWFKGFQQGQTQYQDYFITVEPDTDLSMVVRPRALPLLTPVETQAGTRYVWTTFSGDQIDLNFASPEVLFEIVDLLLFYVEKGAEIIRLDAIAYLWKEIGTSSIHLPKTHQVVKLFRAVLDAVAPGVILITETNVPHEENISYFGEPMVEPDSPDPRGDEAQMVYQFSLAPLVLHTFHTGDSRTLTDWAACLEVPYPTANYFNFIASHDGIGVRPAEGLLTPSEIQTLIDRTTEHGGQVSYKTNTDGSKSAYELNITLFDALNNPQDPQPWFDVRRFLSSQAIMLSLAGVPAIYVHSLFGSRNCYVCADQTGRARSINREKFQLAELQASLSDPHSLTSQVFNGYKNMLKTRRAHSAFHPFGSQQTLSLQSDLFAVLRTSPDEQQRVLCLINVSHKETTADLNSTEIHVSQSQRLVDLISGNSYPISKQQTRVTLEPYQYLWLTRKAP